MVFTTTRAGYGVGVTGDGGDVPHRPESVGKSGGLLAQKVRRAGAERDWRGRGVRRERRRPLAPLKVSHVNGTGTLKRDVLVEWVSDPLQIAGFAGQTPANAREDETSGLGGAIKPNVVRCERRSS